MSVRSINEIRQNSQELKDLGFQLKQSGSKKEDDTQSNPVIFSHLESLIKERNDKKTLIIDSKRRKATQRFKRILRETGTNTSANMHSFRNYNSPKAH